MRSTAFLGVATHTMRPSGSFVVLQPSLPSCATLPGGGPLQAQHDGIVSTAQVVASHAQAAGGAHAPCGVGALDLSALGSAA